MTTHEDYPIKIDIQGQAPLELYRAKVYHPDSDVIIYTGQWKPVKSEAERDAIRWIDIQVADNNAIDARVEQRTVAHLTQENARLMGRMKELEAALDRVDWALYQKITSIEDGALTEDMSTDQVHAMLCDIRDILEGEVK